MPYVWSSGGRGLGTRIGLGLQFGVGQVPILIPGCFLYEAEPEFLFEINPALIREAKQNP